MEINDDDFEKEVIESSKKNLVVVDFWAAWCGPCRMLSPIIDKISQDYKGKAKFVKVNVEENYESPREYGVMSIPNVKMFRNGKVVDEFVGAIPEIQIRTWIDKNLR